MFHNYLLTSFYRYKNTDFILHWVLSRMGMKALAITYDIACQYKKHWKERIDSLPRALRNLPIPKVTWGLPVWHGKGHGLKCEEENSLKYQVGVGKTDGEGPERLWSVLNPMSFMTKEEHHGARHDDIEDFINMHNHKKNLSMGAFISG